MLSLRPNYLLVAVHAMLSLQGMSCFMQVQQQGQQERLWVLKENTHRGQGVLVVPEAEAVARAGAAQAGDGGEGPEMVQAYLGEQYTVAGRRFYLR
jgi:hypothetical protein